MTTETQTTTDGGSVPRYFSDFVQENARQYAELRDRVSGVEGQLKIIKGVAIAILAAVAVSALTSVWTVFELVSG